MPHWKGDGVAPKTKGPSFSRKLGDPLGLDRIYVQAKRYADGNMVGA